MQLHNLGVTRILVDTLTINKENYCRHNICKNQTCHGTHVLKCATCKRKGTGTCKLWKGLKFYPLHKRHLQKALDFL